MLQFPHIYYELLPAVAGLEYEALAIKSPWKNMRIFIYYLHPGALAPQPPAFQLSSTKH